MNRALRGASAVVLAVLLAPPAATAQQPGKVYRIGYLSPRPGIETPEELFRQGMLGYVEGQNLVIDWRRVSAHAGRPGLDDGPRRAAIGS